MIRAMQHDTCKLHKGNRTWKKTSTVGSISTPGSLKLLKGIPCAVGFYGSLILRHPFQPLGAPCLKEKVIQILGHQLGLLLGFPMGILPWKWAQRVPIHLFVRIQIPTLAPLKPMKSDISYKIATWIENIPLSNELQMWNLRKNDV